MSDMGAIMDAIVTAAETAVAGLVSERGVRLSANLNPEDFPHLFVHSPSETIELFPHQQERVTTQIELILVTRGETQEATVLKVDAIRNQIRTDKTLGGIVRWAYVSSRGIREHPKVNEKAGDMAVVTVAEA